VLRAVNDCVFLQSSLVFVFMSSGVFCVEENTNVLVSSQFVYIKMRH
jgi:hypothetical protein